MCETPYERKCILFTNRYSELIPALARATRLQCIVHPTEPREQVALLQELCPNGTALQCYTPSTAGAVAKALLDLAPDLLITYAFQHILPAYYADVCPGINLHPSLLPAYPGLNPWQEQMRDGVKQGGYTIHRLTPQVDAGEILDSVTFTWPTPTPPLTELRDSTLLQYGIPLLLKLLKNQDNISFQP